MILASHGQANWHPVTWLEFCTVMGERFAALPKAAQKDLAPLLPLSAPLELDWATAKKAGVWFGDWVDLCGWDDGDYHHSHGYKLAAGLLLAGANRVPFTLTEVDD